MSKTHATLNIKLIDFGISLIHTDEKHLTEKIGTVKKITQKK
jgi:hypothetical protein